MRLPLERPCLVDRRHAAAGLQPLWEYLALPIGAEKSRRRTEARHSRARRNHFAGRTLWRDADRARRPGSGRNRNQSVLRRRYGARGTFGDARVVLAWQRVSSSG